LNHVGDGLQWFGQIEDVPNWLKRVPARGDFLTERLSKLPNEVELPVTQSLPGLALKRRRKRGAELRQLAQVTNYWACQSRNQAHELDSALRALSTTTHFEPVKILLNKIWNCEPCERLQALRWQRTTASLHGQAKPT